MLAEYDFSEAINKVAIQEGIGNFTFKSQNGSNKGDNYLGIITAVEIIGQKKTIDLILKYSSRSAKIHEIFPLSGLFLNEISFYKAVPILIKFQKDAGIKNIFDNVPKCYLTIDRPFRDEVLVLENLRTSGYELWNRKKLMNREHVEMMLGTFAKFHGISYAMKWTRPELFEEISKKYFDNAAVFEELQEKLGMDSFIENGKALWDIFDPNNPKEKPIREAFERFTNKLDHVIQYDKIQNETCVISQGDCWCNNMMFNYQDAQVKQKPLDIKLLDFQLARVATPILDLSYCFYASASKDSLDKLDYYLKYYHSKLGEYLNQYDCDVEKIYPLKRFLQDWQELGHFGLAMCFVVRKIMLFDSEEVPDTIEAPKEDDNTTFLEKLNFTSRYEDEFKRQIKELVVHFYERKFI